MYTYTTLMSWFLTIVALLEMMEWRPPVHGSESPRSFGGQSHPMPECILASWMTTRGSLTPSCSEVVTVFVSCVAAGVVAVVVSLWAGAFAHAGMLV